MYLRDNVDYHLDRLNSTELCGINDWRLPSLQDAISIFHYSQPDPSSLSYFDEDYFNGGMYPFWILEGDKYFNVNGNGYVNTYPGDKWMVLGVHKPGVNNSKLGPVSYYSNDFIVDEKTAKDSRTGLEWTRCSNQQLVTNGVCVSINETYSWKDTIELVETLNATTGFAGYFDWRLPNTKELYTILTGSSTKWSIRINSDVFPLTSTDGAIPTSTFSTSLIYLKLPYGEHKFTGRDSSVLTDIMLVRDY